MMVHYIVGGVGDMSEAGEYAGGAYDPDMTTWAAAQGVNGKWLARSWGTGVVDSDGGNVRVTEVGLYGDAVDGVYAFFGATNYTPGRYKALSHTANSVTLDLTWTSDQTDASCIVGGAIADEVQANDTLTFEIATDLAAAGDIVKIRNTMVFNNSTDINIDGTSGNSTNHVIVESVDEAGVRDLINKILITHITISGLPVIHLSSDISYWDFVGFDFNGNSKSAFVLQSITAENYNSFHSCIFRDPIPTTHVVRFAGDYLHLHDCEITGATNGTANGIDNYSIGAWYESCYIHHNSGYGIYLSGPGRHNQRIMDCRITNNTLGGIFTSFHPFGTYVGNCTIAYNGGHGINFSGSLTDLYVSHCNITNNTGYGIHTNGLGPRHTVFEYNNSYNNSSGHMDVATGNAAWIKAGQGNNLVLNPQYDANRFIKNIALIQGGYDKKPIGPRHRPWIPPFDRSAA